MECFAGLPAETAFIALQSKRHRYDAKLPNRSSPRTPMHHGFSPPQDADPFGLIYGFRFRPGEAGREIDSATALACLRQAPRRSRTSSSGCT